MIKLLLENAPVIALIGAILAATGAWMTQIQSQRESARLQSELREKAETIATLQEELKEKAQETLNYQTGGDSYPSISFIGFRSDDTSTEFNVQVWNHGDYPMYELNIFLDPTLEEWETATPSAGTGTSFQDLGLRAMEQTKKSGPIELSPGERQVLGSFKVDSIDKLDFSISMQARNGYWSQTLRYRKVESEWIESSQIRTNTGEVLLEYSRDGYPND